VGRRHQDRLAQADDGRDDGQILRCCSFGLGDVRDGRAGGVTTIAPLLERIPDFAALLESGRPTMVSSADWRR
jgi:hypothetical protein